MTIVDFEPAARRLSELLRGVPDDLLDGPTPCPDYTLGDLVEHIGGLARALTATATKASITGGPGGSPPPAGDASRLPADWRTRIPADLDTLAAAWREPDAWTGMTRAGGVDLPGEVAGLVALDEVVVHGWDVARATGQPYDVDDETLEAVLGFLVPFADPSQASMRGRAFGPVVEVPADRRLLDRVIGLTGRVPGWSGSSG